MNFQVNPDSCDNPEHYESYLRLNALTDKIIGRGITHVLIDDDTGDGAEAIVGFVALRASSLISDNYDEITGRAAIEITEIAIDKCYEGKGFGTSLLKLAISLADDMRNNYVGIEYIVACADSASESFYKKNRFSRVSDYYDIPREGWNKNCIPMVLKLPEIELKQDL
jgi:ribosomal protein S18 acetylase RimI-like enzyme